MSFYAPFFIPYAALYYHTHGAKKEKSYFVFIATVETQKNCIFGLKRGLGYFAVR